MFYLRFLKLASVFAQSYLHIKTEIGLFLNQYYPLRPPGVK